MNQEILTKIKQQPSTSSTKLFWMYLLLEDKQVIERKASELASEWGMTLRTFRRGLKELIKEGIIRIVESHPLCPGDSIYHRIVVEGSSISLMKRNPILFGYQWNS